MRHIILAGISVAALAACTSLDATTAPPSTEPTMQVQPVAQAEPPAPAAPAQAKPERVTVADAIAPARPVAPGPYTLIADAELTTGMPHLAAEGDAKAYAASFIHWVMTPGHMIERSRMLATGSPPEMADPYEFSSLVRELASDGSAEARLFNTVGGANDMTVLEGNALPLAEFFLQTHRLHQGSLLQKIDALTWLRNASETNMDAAFALGGFLIDQGVVQDYVGPSTRLLATQAEITEGTQLLKRVAAHTTLESMIHIASLLEQTVDTPAGDPVALRELLELTVAATSTTATDETVMPSGLSQALGGGGSADSVYQAASLRISLADMLAAGRGGPADPARAKTLYLEVAQATQDTDALKALKRMGVDVSAYEPPDDTSVKRPGPGGDGWEDQ